jgi:hypothetical protein
VAARTQRSLGKISLRTLKLMIEVGLLKTAFNRFVTAVAALGVLHRWRVPSAGWHDIRSWHRYWDATQDQGTTSTIWNTAVAKRRELCALCR